MNKWLKRILIIIVVLLIAAVVAVALITRNVASDMMVDPVEERDWNEQSPADFDAIYEDIGVTTPSGIDLRGWYIPPQNGALIILQHGYEENRQNMIEEAEMLYRHGYGVLLTSVRGHDQNGEEMITFGCHEMEDMEAWYQAMLSRDEVDPERIGILGQSMGGSLAIQYGWQNENIKAVVAHSPLTSLNDTVFIGLKHYSSVPEPLIPVLAPLIVFWGERITGCDLDDIDAKEWIGEISPRPVYLICGGKDALVLEENCRTLNDAAQDPSEFWFEEKCDHHECDTVYPEEFERRIIGFFDHYLLGET
jgi:esterase/lipase